MELMFQNMKVSGFMSGAGSVKSRRNKKGDVGGEGCAMVMSKVKVEVGSVEISGAGARGRMTGVGVVSTCSGVDDGAVMDDGAVSGGA